MVLNLIHYDKTTNANIYVCYVSTKQITKIIGGVKPYDMSTHVCEEKKILGVFLKLKEGKN